MCFHTYFRLLFLILLINKQQKSQVHWHLAVIKAIATGKQATNKLRGIREGWRILIIMLSNGLIREMRMAPRLYLSLGFIVLLTLKEDFLIQLQRPSTAMAVSYMYELRVSVLIFEALLQNYTADYILPICVLQSCYWKHHILLSEF